MAFHHKLATRILKAANERHAELIRDFSDLQRITGFTDKPWDDDWRLALESLLREGLIKLDHPLRSGGEQVLLGFIGLRITQAGRNAA
jgi:hypothetical protein